MAGVICGPGTGPQKQYQSKYEMYISADGTNEESCTRVFSRTINFFQRGAKSCKHTVILVSDGIGQPVGFSKHTFRSKVLSKYESSLIRKFLHCTNNDEFDLNTQSRIQL